MWHISSIPDHETVFIPAPLSVAADSPTSSCNTATKTPGDTASIGTSTENSFTNGAYFCERVIGKTWSGTPTVVLRSLRASGRDEAACAARWVHGDGSDGGGIFGDDDGWTDRRLRLLADEWRVCAELGTHYGIVDDVEDVPFKPQPSPTPAEVDASHVGAFESRQGASKPFMVHTGHLIVPFGNGRVRQQDGGDTNVIGHGVVLAVDRGVDWRRWESHLTDVAAAATRCFERLEHEGYAAEKARAKTWAKQLLHSRNPEASCDVGGCAGNVVTGETKQSREQRIGKTATS